MNAERAGPIRALRRRKCRTCREWFSPTRSAQVVCQEPQCAIEEGRRQGRAEAKRQLAADKERIKTIPRLTREAQAAFNAWILFRDRKEPCISCDENKPAKGIRGGRFDCGHYKPVGSHPALRFCEANAHKQCKKCNGGAGRATRKNKTVSDSYRPRLIMKIGLAKVCWLESPHPDRTYTKDELRAIRDIYRAKLRHVKKALAATELSESEPGP